MEDPDILKKEGRKTISPVVVIYRKCTQRTICLLYGKRRLIEKKFWANRGGRPPHRPSPFESATELWYSALQPVWAADP